MVTEIREVEGQEERMPLKQALYTLEEIAELMGVSYAAAWGYQSSGTLPWKPLRVGRKLFYRRAEVDRDLGIESEG